MTRNTGDGQPTFRAVPQGRVLTSSEHDSLSRLASAVERELSDQVAQCVVVGECICGCSSIQLSTSAPPLPEDETRLQSTTGRSDYFCVSSTVRSPAGHEIFLGLHVVRGRLHELEVFDVDAGESATVDLTRVTEMTAPEVT